MTFCEFWKKPPFLAFLRKFVFFCPNFPSIYVENTSKNPVRACFFVTKNLGNLGIKSETDFQTPRKVDFWRFLVIFREKKKVHFSGNPEIPDFGPPGGPPGTPPGPGPGSPILAILGPGGHFGPQNPDFGP